MSHTVKKLVPPKYDANEPVTQYLKDVDEYLLNITKEKYNLILQFVNAWLNVKQKLKSLTEFKDISLSYLIKNKEHNKEILKQYGDNIRILLNIDDKKTTVIDDVENEKYNDKYIILFLGKALKCINYSLTNKKVVRNNSTITRYTIKMS